MSIDKAISLLRAVRGKKLNENQRIEHSIQLASLLLKESQLRQTKHERQTMAELSRMMEDPTGKVFTTSMMDQCFRTNDPLRIANQLQFLLQKYGIPSFLTVDKKFALLLFKWFGHWCTERWVKVIKSIIRTQTSTVVLPEEEPEFTNHLQKRKEEGVQVNLNHLGEAILGEQEAKNRLGTYLKDLERPDVKYISVKISTLFSQINLLAWEHTRVELVTRFQQLLRKAKNCKPAKFVNLDMEEYRDLQLTVEVFKKALDDRDFFDCAAGIVLQSYLPEAFSFQQDLTEWARRRVAAGGAPIKIRIVKGANLAMEQVEASLKGWPQAPFTSKNETDSNFKLMITYGCSFENAKAVHIGVGSHNLFDITYALILSAENQIEKFVTIEMLEGMADHLRRVIQDVSDNVLLYCPVAKESEFQNAVAYLMRRLDENTAPNNFLRCIFNLRIGSKAWEHQAGSFAIACRNKDNLNLCSRRNQNRMQIPPEMELQSSFCNEPDTDWSLLENRIWLQQNIVQKWSKKSFLTIPLVIDGEEIFTDKRAFGTDPANPSQNLYQYSLAENSHIESALKTAKKAENEWKELGVHHRSTILAEIAQRLRKQRAELIGAMMADGGKTPSEADVEVSEAIDFAEYYRRNAEEMFSLEDLKWNPKGTVVVAPPWNFPCSIPTGSVLAALAAGNCVIFKPASETVLVAWLLAQIFWQSGISKQVLQFITCEDEPIGSALIKDSRVNVVVLTGSTATAEHMLQLRPGLDLIAETGGKNAIIISKMADRDLAVRDVIQSAFGHAGQKCSACSLIICESEVYDDQYFLKQLRDAAASLKVGSQWNLSSKINPLIRSPNQTLHRALTSLEQGESWLLEPKQDETNPNLWSPGIKLGVTCGSFTQQNELFGPVLGVMRAASLEQAVDMANRTFYGLTSGLHSLDEREHQYWIKHIEAGNLYINRTITGAIVQRQPFGGCKASSFGPGSKAGGPNYVRQLMSATQKDLPQHFLDTDAWPKKLLELLSQFQNREYGKRAIGSYLFFWKLYFSKKIDPSLILGQDNWFFYKPNPLILRLQSEDIADDVLLSKAAAMICGTPLYISNENAEQFLEKVEKYSRIRFLSKPPEYIQKALSDKACTILHAPVLANGRIELLHYLREVSLSVDYHRYGYLGDREQDPRGALPKEGICGPGCCRSKK